MIAAHLEALRVNTHVQKYRRIVRGLARVRRHTRDPRTCAEDSRIKAQRPAPPAVANYNDLVQRPGRLNTRGEMQDLRRRVQLRRGACERERHRHICRIIRTVDHTNAAGIVPRRHRALIYPDH